MKTLIDAGNNVSQELHTDAHIKDRQVFRTVYHDDEALRKNERLRREGLMVRGTKLPMFDGQEVQYAFSIPTVEQYHRMKKDYPDLMQALVSKDASIRIPAARRFAIMKPEWCVLAD